MSDTEKIEAKVTEAVQRQLGEASKAEESPVGFTVASSTWKFLASLLSALVVVGGLSWKGLQAVNEKQDHDKQMHLQLEILVRTVSSQSGVLYAICVNQASLIANDAVRGKALIECQASRPPEDIIGATTKKETRL